MNDNSFFIENSLNFFKLEKFTSTFTNEIPKIGLRPPDTWRIYNFKHKSGLLIIKNPFTSIGQRYWITKLLRDYTKSNPNNLLPARFNKSIIEDFWQSLTNESDEQQRALIKKSMRWTTLGYHYDWTNKVYLEANKSVFPKDLAHLVKVIADCLHFADYKSEAAIINFYPVGTTLSAHTDHSEFFLDSPLFSFSFGQPAIFLIGGRERDDEVAPILLQSGDIVVMSGESRLFYHAVPRVFRDEKKTSWNDDEEVERCAELPREDVEECLKQSKWDVFNQYLNESRINLNVRQVNK